MSSRVAYYFASVVVILAHNLIFPVKGQCTVEGCENGDTSNSIVAEIQQLCVEAIRQQQNKQFQSIHLLLNASFQQMKNHLQDTINISLQAIDQRSQEQVQSIHELLNASFEQMKTQDNYTVMTSLQAIDRRSQEQVQSIYDFLNASFQQIQNQQDTVMTSLQAIDRRSQEQDIYIKQVQRIHELLNASFQQMKNQNDTVMTSLQAIDRRSLEQDIYIKQVQSIHELLNASNQQMKTQHETVLRSVEAFDRRLQEHDISIKNQTQNSWKVEIAIGIDLEEGPILPPIVNNWIVLMHRFDGSLNFSRNWIEYKNGFGNIGRGEFWLGNEKIHRLTNRFFYTLRIEVQLNTNGRWFNADYATFSLGSEDNKYAIHVAGFSGNAGDSLTNTSIQPNNYHHNGMSFTTWDADNDRSSSTYNCAQVYGGGWWFNHCYHTCLTCTYSGSDFLWSFSGGWQTSGKLRATRMMIKSK